MNNTELMLVFMCLGILGGCLAALMLFILVVLWLFSAKPETKKPFKKMFVSSLTFASICFVIMGING